MARRRRSGAAPIVAGVAVVAGLGIIGYAILKSKGVTGGGGFSISLQTNPITQGSNEQVNISGASPNGSLQVEVLTNNGLDLVLSPNPVANSAGAVSYVFLVGTNIPTGTNTVKVTDLNTGRIATQTFTVS